MPNNNIMDNSHIVRSQGLITIGAAFKDQLASVT